MSTRPNLWPFRKRRKVAKAKPARRSTMTLGQAITKARAAGKESGDTGLFERWLQSARLADRSKTVRDRLRREYEAGFESKFHQTYKGHAIKPVAEEFAVPSIDSSSRFDSVADARKFIEQWTRKNPRRQVMYDGIRWWVVGTIKKGQFAGQLHLQSVSGDAEAIVSPEKVQPVLQSNPTDRAHRYRANATPPPGPKVCLFCRSKRNVEVGHIDGHEEDSAPENLIWTCRSCNVIAGNTLKAANLGRRTRQFNPDNNFIVSDLEIAELIALRREAVKERDTGKPIGAENLYFSRIDQLADIYRVPAQAIQRDLSLREQGYLHETEHRKGVTPRWRKNPTKSGGASNIGEWMNAVGAIVPHKGAKYSGANYGISSTMSTAEAVAMIRATPASKRSEFAGKVRTTKRGRARAADERWNPEHKRRNPQSEADALYESFHGKPSTETVEITEEVHEHQHLATLGKLVDVWIETPTGLLAHLEFDPTDAPWLASSEDGRQLYIEGGDQSIDLATLKMDGAEWVKDRMVLGTFARPEPRDKGKGRRKHNLTYHTEKEFDGFEAVDYQHDLGEETGVRPTLEYEPRNQRLLIAGGQYRIEQPLFGMSPGIEN